MEMTEFLYNQATEEERKAMFMSMCARATIYNREVERLSTEIKRLQTKLLRPHIKHGSPEWYASMKELSTRMKAEDERIEAAGGKRDCAICDTINMPDARECRGCGSRIHGY